MPATELLSQDEILDSVLPRQLSFHHQFISPKSTPLSMRESMHQADTKVLSEDRFSLTCQTFCSILIQLRLKVRIMFSLFFFFESLSTDIENKLMVIKRQGGRINQEFRIKIFTLVYIKLITNKDLLYSTRNYSQYFVIV